MKMILLVSLCCLGLAGAAELERIESCGVRCSQGLQCRTKPHAFFPPPCQNRPEGLDASSVFRNVSLSTVMRCEGRQKCWLHLRIGIQLQLTEAVHGVSVCTVSPGMMEECRNITFRRSSRERLSGLQVEVQSDCTDVSLGQEVTVTVKTTPSYCGVTWTGAHKAPECTSQDLQRHIPECITGTLSYDINPETKELMVGVSDMLEDHDYRLRLCHKDFICMGTGVDALIKKDEPERVVKLPYSQPLPCLCIEGWSMVMDAPRVQVCPFKDRLEELWSGINFDPLEGTLSWKPSCPITAVVALCQQREEVCEDLPHTSRNIGREKITFTRVDPHPSLCMKFTAGSRSWTRCPFADARFQAWEVVSTLGESHEDVTMLSHNSATFSVELCGKSEDSVGCQVTETHVMHVEKNKAVGLKLMGERCDACLQVKRLDVNFAPTILHCLHQCNHSSLPRPVVSHHATWDLTPVIVPAAVFLSGIVIVMLALTVCKSWKSKHEGCTSEKQTDLDFDCMVPVLQSNPVLREVLIPDLPQCGNTEKVNLISD
ncbi:interleukin-17 receptor E-like protein [Antennarius striatus]|uniref:interleukin-17 receptor E-like protein n=1 Tax=Antennarius striatus TaxID=241820 RepID=UPI0035B16447